MKSSSSQARLELLRICIFWRCAVIAKVSISYICLRHLWMYIFRPVLPSNWGAIRDWRCFSRCTEVLLDIDGLFRLVEPEILRPTNRIWRLDTWTSGWQSRSNHRLMATDKVFQKPAFCVNPCLATVSLCRHLVRIRHVFFIVYISGSYVL